MIKQLGVSEAREQFTRIPEIFEEEPDTHAIEVKRHGKTIFAIIPLDFYEEIAETLEIMADKEFYSELKEGIHNLEEGETFSLEEVKKELGF